MQVEIGDFVKLEIVQYDNDAQNTIKREQLWFKVMKLPDEPDGQYLGMLQDSPKLIGMSFRDVMIFHEIDIVQIQKR
jgi:hypothetical protein